ncbi:MAG: hypothetical protein ACRD3Q_13435 [Terriglobales bacterium]
MPVSTIVDEGTNAAVLRGEPRVPVSRRQATARFLSPTHVYSLTLDSGRRRN